MRIPRAPQFALLTAAALVLTACGGDNGGGGGSSADGSSSGPLRIMPSGQYDLTMIGVEAGKFLGTYKDRGLEVDVLEGQESVQALESGDVDVALSSPNRFIGAIQQGAEITLVGPTINEWGQYIIVRSDLAAQKPEDLKGGKWGVSSFGSAGHYSTTKMADELGWAEGDYEIVTMGDLDGLQAGLRNGTIDGFMWSAQAAFSLEQEGVARVLGNVGDLIGPNPLDVIAVSNQTLKDRPKDVKAFCEGFYEAQKKFQDDPALAEKTFIEQWDFDPTITPRILDAGLPLLSTSPEMGEEMFANMAEATAFTIDGAKVTGDDVKGMYTNCSEL